MKLFLIDGHALIFKMYYAFLGRPMVNGKGQDTSILFGFTKYLLEMIAREKPTHIAVSFDPPGGTFRNRMYDKYKANRGETPQLVIDALEPLTAIVKSLGIPVLMVMDYEADDVVGTVAKRFAAEGTDVYMVTPDKDYGQLVAPHIFQYRPGKSGADAEILSEKEVCEKYGISSTLQVIDVLALCGDSADNVPGVQGVGPVGASKLLGKYGSLEGIYEHVSELTEKQRAMFEAAEGHIGLSKELVTICTSVPVDVSLDDMKVPTACTGSFMALADNYEMPSIKRLATRIFGSVVQDAPGAEAAAQPGNPAKAVKEPAEVATAIALYGTTLYLTDKSGSRKAEAGEFRSLLENPDVPKAGFDLKSAIRKLGAIGITMKGKLLDVELMHYVLNPERSHSLETLASEYLGETIDSSGNADTGSLFDEIPDSGEADHSLETKALSRLAPILVEELRSNSLSNGKTLLDLYETIEEPLIRVLARMEDNGVKVDVASLREYSRSLSDAMNREEAEVRSLAGEPALNVSSPKQIGTVIFEKLQLDPKAKKPKSGNWPTDEQTLSELADRSPIIDAILEYRGLRKLLNTYIEPFPGYISEVDGRVHTTFNQALTSTGRLSSSNPNLQNIPIRTEQGREIRKAFVPGEEGWVMMSADYSQIELRIMAHMCGDAHLQSAFRSGVDVHAATAARIFHVDVADVTADQRRVAKTANFGIMYGISSFGLSQRLKCSRSEAKQIIDDYFASFPSIRMWIDETLRKAREFGYVETLFGRRRYVPDVNSSNGNIRSLAERNAVNAPIQGSSADIIKLAMTGVDRKLSELSLKSRMVLQIHDELVLEVPQNEIDTVKGLLTSEMEGVVSLSVPLTVECNYGKTWLDAH